MTTRAHLAPTAVSASAGVAPLRRPGAAGADRVAAPQDPREPTYRDDGDRDARLDSYDIAVKSAFDRIVPTLKRIAALQHEADFPARARAISIGELGFDLPGEILERAWIEPLDTKRLYAWCVFATYVRFCDDFFLNRPLDERNVNGFARFLEECGFHTFDVSPCSDGRLAHLVSYVLRLPYRAVRRKSYAGAMFDIDDSVAKWVETEHGRYREGRPNTADAPTRYLKVVAYHYSSVDAAREGCAAHGSDAGRAARAGLERLESFRTAIENTFCCGASIDLLLIGVDTATDAIRVHYPDSEGAIELDRYIDAAALTTQSPRASSTEIEDAVRRAAESSAANTGAGMVRLIARLLANNLVHVEYVRRRHGDHYQDIGHAERFIGAGVGFEEVQLRNLMYFAYLDTVESATDDLDVGIRIFERLNVSRSLPIPVIVRFDYHARVPGARERAVARASRVARALGTRYASLVERGMLHVLEAVRDCTSGSAIEVVGSSVGTGLKEAVAT